MAKMKLELERERQVKENVTRDRDEKKTWINKYRTQMIEKESMIQKLEE